MLTKLICDGCHKRVFGLRYVKAGSLNYHGLIALNKHGVRSVLGDLSSVVGNYLVEPDVIGALMLANGVNAAHGLVVFKIKRDIDVRILAREVEHAYSLVADQLALFGIAHKSVGNKPDLFSVHNIVPFKYRGAVYFYNNSISFLEKSVKA